MEKPRETKKCFPRNFVAEIIFFVFKISESLLEPSLRLYIYQEICLKFSTFSDEHICRNLPRHPKEEEELQSQAAFYLTIYRVLVNLPALFLCAFCGSWSDRVGRKHPIIISSLSSIVGVTFFLINSNLLSYQTIHASINSSLNFTNQTSIRSQNHDDHRKEQIIFISMIFMGSFFRGLSGKGSIVTMAVHSYVSDMSDKTTRTQRLGCLLSMNFFGLFVGSLLVGICLEKFGFDVIFLFVIFLHLICIVFAVIYMNGKGTDTSDKYSDSSTTDNNNSEKAKLIFFHWKNLCDFFNLLRNFPNCRVFFFFIVIIVQQAFKSGEIDVTLLYTMKVPLSWNKSLYGYFLATDYLCLGLATSAFLPLLIKMFKIRDVSLSVIGVAFKILRITILAFSTSTWMVFVSVVCGCPSALIISCLKSLISKSFHERDLGKIFALLSGCETFSSLIGNIFFNYIYVATYSLYAGFVFCLDSFIFFFVLLGLIYIGCTDDDASDQEKPFYPTSEIELGNDNYGSLKGMPEIILDQQPLKTFND